MFHIRLSLVKNPTIDVVLKLTLVEAEISVILLRVKYRSQLEEATDQDTLP